MLTPNPRNIIFLKQFTKEIIKNLAPKEQRQIIEKKLNEAEKMQANQNPAILQQALMPFMPQLRTRSAFSLQQPIIPRQSFQQLMPGINKLPTPPQNLEIQPEIKQAIAPGEINLGKISQLIQDPAVTMIECPSPDKFVTVKKMNEINITSIKLSEKEIADIIKEFSDRTRIPIIQGTFKAAFKNLIITAVISEFVGSRFIITKYTPFSLIEN
jgi:hypothetical protein